MLKAEIKLQIYFCHDVALSINQDQLLHSETLEILKDWVGT